MTSPTAVLLLEDGTRFDGLPFGAAGEAMGEAVFYTGVVGYQEVITHPSYRGTLAVLTYPIIGSYGVNPDDDESPAACVSGVVIKEYSRTYSNFRATGSLEDFLVERGVVGIQGVDTRAVTVHLREHGEMRGVIASGDVDERALLARLRREASPFRTGLVRGLPRQEPASPSGEPTHGLAVFDLGITRSLLAHLVLLGCAVDILPPTASADDVLASKPDGVVVAGGPGDPRVLDDAVATVKALVGKVPLFGIGLGHQVLALALGCQVERMRVGHRGVNHPVKELPTGRSEITVQHHSFVVNGEPIPDGVEVTHVNLNDKTVEGIRSTTLRAASVQFHPSLDEMGQPHRLLAAFVGDRERS